MIESNLKDFTIGLETFSKNVEQELKRFIKKLAIDLHRRLIERTPVSDGYARASWNLSIGAPDTSVPKNFSSVKKGEKRNRYNVERALATQSRLARFSDPFSQTVWINNSVDYILFLEAGRSPKAPAGIMLPTLAELQAESAVGFL